MAGQIDCPAPLPEGPIDALLAKMLTSAPYKVSEKTKSSKEFPTPGVVGLTVR